MASTVLKDDAPAMFVLTGAESTSKCCTFRRFIAWKTQRKNESEICDIKMPQERRQGKGLLKLKLSSLKCKLKYKSTHLNGDTRAIGTG